MMALRNKNLSKQYGRDVWGLHAFSLMRMIATIARPGDELTAVCQAHREADPLPPSLEDAYRYFVAQRLETTL